VAERTSTAALEFNVGAMTLLALGFFAWLILFVGDVSPFGEEYRLYADFDEIQLLQQGDPVRKNGLIIGKVEGFRFEGNRIRTTILIQGDYKIRKDAKVAVGNVGLFGANYVKVTEPTLAKGKEDPGDYLGGDIIEGEAAPEFETLLNEGTLLLGDLRDTVRALTAILDDEQLREDLLGAVAELREATRSGRRTLENLEGSMKTVMEDAEGSARAARKLVEGEGGVDGALAKLNRLLDEVGDLAEENRAQLKATTTAVQEVVEDIRDQALSAKLANAAGEMERFARELADFVEDLNNNGATPESIRRITDRVESITGDLAEMTSTTKDAIVDSDLKGNLSQAFDDVHTIAGRVDELGSKLGEIRTNVVAGLFYSDSVDDFRPELNARVTLGDAGFLRFGAEDIGAGDDLNAQLGRKLSPSDQLRLGIVAGEFGIGYDRYLFGRAVQLRLEAYRPDDLLFRYAARLRSSLCSPSTRPTPSRSNRRAEARTSKGTARSPWRMLLTCRWWHAIGNASWSSNFHAFSSRSVTSAWLASSIRASTCSSGSRSFRAAFITARYSSGSDWASTIRPTSCSSPAVKAESVSSPPPPRARASCDAISPVAIACSQKARLSIAPPSWLRCSITVMLSTTWRICFRPMFITAWFTESTCLPRLKTAEFASFSTFSDTAWSRRTARLSCWIDASYDRVIRRMSVTTGDIARNSPTSATASSSCRREMIGFRSRSSVIALASEGMPIRATRGGRGVSPDAGPGGVGRVCSDTGGAAGSAADGGGVGPATGSAAGGGAATIRPLWRPCAAIARRIFWSTSLSSNRPLRMKSLTPWDAADSRRLRSSNPVIRMTGGPAALALSTASPPSPGISRSSSTRSIPSPASVAIASSLCRAVRVRNPLTRSASARHSRTSGSSSMISTVLMPRRPPVSRSPDCLSGRKVAQLATGLPARPNQSKRLCGVGGLVAR